MLAKYTLNAACIQCDARFHAKPYRLRKGEAQFCGKACIYEWRRQETARTFTERFWVRVSKDTSLPAACPELGPCWSWVGDHSRAGYGWTWEGSRPNRKLTYCHRIAYALTYGPIPDGLLIRHRCDNPPCCNPTHLVVGTHADNSADAVARHRMRSGDEHGLRRHPERAASGDRNGSRTRPERMPRGEGHWNASLTADTVKEIRRLWATGEYTQAALAVRFLLAAVRIHKIVHNQTWKHIK